MTIKVVAVRGVHDEWVCIFGQADHADSDVADSGFKLPAEAAKVLFPNISGWYRE